MRRISAQIALSYLPIVALTAAIGLFAATLLGDLGGTVGRVLAENYRSVVAAERMARAVDGQEAARLAGQGPAFDAAGGAFRAALESATGAAVLPDEPALLDSIRTGHAAYLVDVRARRPSAATRADALRQLSDRLLRVNEEAILDKNVRAERAAERAQRSLLLAVLAAVVVSGLAGSQFARRIAGPIRSLTEGVGAVAQGRFESHVDEAAVGEVGTLAHAFNQMTARLRTFEALNLRALVREKRTAESLVEAIPSPVIVTDGGGRVRLLNGAALDVLGLPRPTSGEPPPLLGRTIADLAPAVAGALSGPADGRVTELPFPGGPRAYQLRRTAVEVPAPSDGTDGHGEETDRLTITLLEDVTPLRALDRARSDFLAAISHELRTPLTSLGTALDLLVRDLAGPLTPDQRELVETAKADADRLKRLVARLLDLARADLSRADLSRADLSRVDRSAPPGRPVDLGDVVRQAAEGVRLVAAERGVTVTVAGRGPAVGGSVEALTLAVSNLVSNAVRHATSAVAVRVEPAPGGAVHVVVEDDGPGLPPGAEARVFEPLVQLSGAEGGRPGSAGLGLAIVRRVADAHGGRTWAEPGPRGRFVLALPAHPEGPRPALP